jgi:hypothetical protein
MIFAIVTIEETTADRVEWPVHISYPLCPSASANSGGPDLRRNSHELPDIGLSGQPESIWSHLARRVKVSNLGVRCDPPVKRTGQILFAHMGIRPDLLLLPTEYN